MCMFVTLCRSQRDYLLSKIKEVEQKLSASKGVRQATERERRLASAANKLKVGINKPGTVLTVTFLSLAWRQTTAASTAWDTDRVLEFNL